MADIFISYSHDDRIKALRLIRALEAQGLTVWWDTDLIPGTPWNQNIARELKSARCAIIAWSEKSCNSSFVKEEAGLALAHNTYVPITFDQIAPPSQFSSIEVLDLSRWFGSTDDPNFVLLLAAIERLRGDKHDETEGVSRKVNKNRSRLRVWGITIGGTFFGFASGVIAKPMIALTSAVVISALGLGAYWTIPRVWTGSHDNQLRISEPQHEAIAVLRGHAAAVLSAGFSPDGKRIVTASGDKTARIWDTETGQEIAVLGHDDAVNSAGFSPDGKRIVTASGDKRTRIWDAETGQEIVVLGRGDDAVNSAGFSPDGRLTVTAEGKTARIWDAVTGQMIAVLRGHDDAVNSAGFSPDGRLIVTASRDRTARIWNAPRPELGR